MPSVDVFDVEFLEPSQPATASSRTALPARAEPGNDEALSSWLLRYAAPFAVSPESLLLDRTDADLLSGPDWWRRPDPLVVTRLAERTGLGQSILAAMTFGDWNLPQELKEIPERFAHVRFQFARPAKRSERRIGICPQCLADDAIPYVRKIWTIGWMGVCSTHALVLINECPQCHHKLRTPRLSSDEHFAPERCERCGFHLSSSPHQPAHTLAVRLQALLLAHRTQSVLELPTIGTLEWSVAFAFFDVLLGTVWNGPKMRFRNQLFARIRRDLDLSDELDGGHYAGLLTLAWLLDEWPTHIRVAFATLKVPRPRRQLERWSQLDSLTKCEIEKVFIPAWRDERHDEDRGWWRGWIDSLPLTGDALRELAMKDRFMSRRMRLLALADVRDGMPVEAAAKIAGVGAKTLYRWIKRGAEGGLEAALQRPSGKLTQLQALEIANWIAAASPDEPRWRFDRVQDEVRRRFGREIADHVAERLLYIHGPWRRRMRFPSRKPALCMLPIAET